MKKLEAWRRKPSKNPRVNYLQGGISSHSSLVSCILNSQWPFLPCCPFSTCILCSHLNWIPPTPQAVSGSGPLHLQWALPWLPSPSTNFSSFRTTFPSVCSVFQSSAPKDDLGVSPLLPCNLIPMYLFIIALFIIHGNHWFFWVSLSYSVCFSREGSIL